MILAIQKLDLFYGDAQALSGVSVTIQEGAIVAIIGANGAGKSSLIRTIAGIETPRGGSIRFRGQEIRGLKSHQVCNLGIGQVPEGRQLFPSLTVQENLEVGAMVPRGKPHRRETLARVYEIFPRLAERRGQAAGTLSGGEQQMVAIGRCLMGRPELIMFDEPSFGLAPALVEEVFRVIERLHADGHTILLVEQNVAASLTMSSYGYVLENGVVSLEGSGQKLLTDDGVRQAYMGL